MSAIQTFTPPPFPAIEQRRPITPREGVRVKPTPVRKKPAETRTLAPRIRRDPPPSSLPEDLQAAAKFKPLEMATKHLYNFSIRVLCAQNGYLPKTKSGTAFCSLEENANRECNFPMKSAKDLGKGAYGAAYLVKDLEADREVVLKTNHAGSSIKYILQELVKNVRVQGIPHIAKLLSYFQNSRTQYALVYEYAGPDLHETTNLRLRTHNPYSLRDIAEILYQTLECLAELHRRGVMHNDLKLDNMTFYRNCVNLLDFGNSLRPAKDNVWRVTVKHMHQAPEVSLGIQNSFPQDIFSLGCIAFSLFAQEPPFNSPSAEPIVSIFGQTFEKEEARNARHLQELQELLGMLPESLIRESESRENYFHIDPTTESPVFLFPFNESALPLQERLIKSMEGYRKDPPDLVRLFGDLLHQMMHPDYRQRITAESALNHPFFKRVRGRLLASPLSSSSLSSERFSSPSDRSGSLLSHSVSSSAIAPIQKPSESFRPLRRSHRSYAFQCFTRALKFWPSYFEDPSASHIAYAIQCLTRALKFWPSYLDEPNPAPQHHAKPSEPVEKQEEVTSEVASIPLLPPFGRQQVSVTAQKQEEVVPDASVQQVTDLSLKPLAPIKRAKQTLLRPHSPEKVVRQPLSLRPKVKAVDSRERKGVLPTLKSKPDFVNPNPWRPSGTVVPLKTAYTVSSALSKLKGNG